MRIEYDFDELGYTVLTLNGATVVDEYHAGNSPYESSAVLPAEQGVELEQLERFALITANEIKDSTGAASVDRNEDIRSNYE